MTAELNKKPVYRTLYAECGYGCQATALAGEPRPLAFTCGHGNSYAWAAQPQKDT